METASPSGHQSLPEKNNVMSSSANAGNAASGCNEDLGEPLGSRHGVRDSDMQGSMPLTNELKDSVSCSNGPKTKMAGTTDTGDAALTETPAVEDGPNAGVLILATEESEALGETNVDEINADVPETEASGQDRQAGVSFQDGKDNGALIEAATNTGPEQPCRDMIDTTLNLKSEETMAATGYGKQDSQIDIGPANVPGMVNQGDFPDAVKSSTVHNGVVPMAKVVIDDHVVPVQELAVWEQVFEPRPSTSRDSGINRIGSPAHAAAAAAAVARADSQEERRTHLKIQPRTTQYEKHPLLQDRSDSGMSEFEMFLLEKEQLALTTASAVSAAAAAAAEKEIPGSASGTQALSSTAEMLEEPHSSSSGTDRSHEFATSESAQPVSENTKELVSKVQDARPKMKPVQHQQQPLQPLVPRGAEWERNPLFQKNESGLSELEAYLREKENEICQKEQYQIYRQASHDSATVPLAEFSTSHQLEQQQQQQQHLQQHLQQPPPGYVPRKGSLPVLRPRISQYQKHALLETKDASGLSELDHFLRQKEEEFSEKGKCSTRCACKNPQCSKCKGSSPRLLTREIEVDTVMRIEPKMNNKRVHFQRQSSVEASQMNATAPQNDSVKTSDKDQGNSGNGVTTNQTLEDNGKYTQTADNQPVVNRSAANADESLSDTRPMKDPKTEEKSALDGPVEGCDAPKGKEAQEVSNLDSTNKATEQLKQNGSKNKTDKKQKASCTIS